MKSLTDRERVILSLRQVPCTYKEIGVYLNISGERVRQCYNKAHRKNADVQEDK